MKRPLALLCVGAFCLASLPSHAAVCMKHKTLVGYLSAKFNEQPKAVGLVASAGLMEVYVSAEGTWTIVMTTPQGIACIVAAGDTWEDVKSSPVAPEF